MTPLLIQIICIMPPDKLFDGTDGTEETFEEETRCDEHVRVQCSKPKGRKSKKNDSPKQERRTKISKKNSFEFEGNFNILLAEMKDNFIQLYWSFL